MCDCRWSSGEHYVYYVKANLLPWHFGLPGVLAGGTNQASLFLEPDGAVRRAVLVSLPGFDFDEDQRIAFPAHQIHLTGAGRQAVIAIHNNNSGALQKPLGDVLAAPAEGVVLGHVPPTGVLPEEIRELEKLAGHNALLVRPSEKRSGSRERMISLQSVAHNAAGRVAPPEHWCRFHPLWEFGLFSGRFFAALRF
jgi:hypothetical protein